MRCECGTERPVRQHQLLSGKSISCGCISRERARQWTVGGVIIATALSIAGLGLMWWLDQRHGNGSATGGIQAVPVAWWMPALIVAGIVMAGLLHYRAIIVAKSQTIERPQLFQPSKLRILSAKYGNPTDGYHDRRERVEHAISGDSLSLLIGREALGDPLEGKWKELVVEYSYDGGQPLKAVRQESRRLILPEDPFLLEQIKASAESKKEAVLPVPQAPAPIPTGGPELCLEFHANVRSCPNTSPQNPLGFFAVENRSPDVDAIKIRFDPIETKSYRLECEMLPYLKHGASPQTLKATLTNKTDGNTFVAIDLENMLEETCSDNYERSLDVVLRYSDSRGNRSLRRVTISANSIELKMGLPLKIINHEIEPDHDAKAAL